MANESQSFIGSYLRGMGFVLKPQDAQALIAEDPKYAEVVFKYLNGEDLNSRPDQSASRWAIDFRDWSEEKAHEYPMTWDIVEQSVKPVRDKAAPGSPIKFWHHWRHRPELHEAITDLEQVVVIALVSRTVMPTRVPANQVLAHKLGVFATDSTGQLAVLSSTFHSAWAWKNSSTMKADLNYSPSDVYETFPRPDETSRLRTAGDALEKAQHAAMSAKDIGLTQLYKLVHLQSEIDPRIEAIRRAHVEVDQTVAEAYGWTDLDLKHGFHTTPQGERFTIAPDVQTEVLDRLLELNHARYKEEMEKGLHTPEAKRRRAAARKAKAKARTTAPVTPSAEGDFGDGLFPQPDALF
nr:hypothetical protein OG999_25880 [Streptomyces sp. NBC_00886]